MVFFFFSGCRCGRVGKYCRDFQGLEERATCAKIRMQPPWSNNCDVCICSQIPPERFEGSPGPSGFRMPSANRFLFLPGGA